LTRDRQLDPPARAIAGNGRRLLPQECQRLVANPFLAIFGLIGWFALMRQALAVRSLPLFGFALLSLGVVILLPQYHCLDCGATGLLIRWKSHACESVRLRQECGQARRIRGPNPWVQTVLWCYLLAALAVLAAAVLLPELA
jgi:hypothetical protein